MQIDLDDCKLPKITGKKEKGAFDSFGILNDSNGHLSHFFRLSLFIVVFFFAASCTQNSAQPIQQKNLKNATMKNYRLLDCMYTDAFFPTKEVDKGKKILLDLCWKIESKPPKSLDELYKLTQQATLQFNKLAADFEAAGSEIETGARECIGENFLFIAKAYGFKDADAEELIGTRDW
jgi:hypothetical protein